MTIAFTLLLASTLVGLAISLYFRVWALMLASLPIALFAAIVLKSSGFGFVTGASLVAGCLVLSQLAYLAGALLSPEFAGSIPEEIDGAPGRHREHKVSGQNK